MKKLIILLFVSTIAMSTTCTKEDNISTGGNSTNINTSAVPAAVKTAFQTRYPNATGQIEWEKEDGNTYKVKFFLGSQRWQAIFAANGSFISERSI